MRGSKATAADIKDPDYSRPGPAAPPAAPPPPLPRCWVVVDHPRRGSTNLGPLLRTCSAFAVDELIITGPPPRRTGTHGAHGAQLHQVPNQVKSAGRTSLDRATRRRTDTSSAVQRKALTPVNAPMKSVMTASRVA